MSHDDFAIEPVKGLPERPPEGEQVLWQGRPDWWALSKDALNVWWIMGYFGVLAAWRFVSLIDQRPLMETVALSVPFLIAGLIVCSLLVIVGYVQARTTVYTVTNRRVAMRIGAALTVTLNLPYNQLINASVQMRRRGVGTIAFEVPEDVKLGYLTCWPHVRPWRVPAQPALRCIPDAERIAAMISDAAEARIATPQVTRKTTAGATAPVAAE
ncbi:photosynthetic complex putative assembly protein PuhB [Lutimaribacter sp. EGI FJ00015]|uniref:Photosynthetic complex putative assembly protein PuhB n=1 Tax=Lutimaribacter degradans TaxID=2945989 RepID=A0ACC5ZVT3_9RHOB|nr:photosynthetic complex putative assembly protein PuhB [Lutimaribacter sp. EGI FJ00013]MCM2562053.1 photosynthetic complex putative assembly protein PuhB [Lutimaribacter sp. EGI FJ00013]MCO0615080.1 photosynthetic complex putative assembly protein PuhB [Lutimaribacter sp. EGI FJ00015]MCO0635885.1 photosynthetic complex putative assembly protein PuhB [Lutimaribacter sp. EGI FJ00014]